MAIGLKLHPWHRSPDWIICHLGDSAVNVLQDIYFLSGILSANFSQFLMDWDVPSLLADEG